MTDDERILAKRRVQAWITAGPLLQQVRDADIRAANTAQMINCCNSLFQQTVKDLPPKPTSGLVEQQRWFARYKAK